MRTDRQTSEGIRQDVAPHVPYVASASSHQAAWCRSDPWRETRLPRIDLEALQCAEPPCAFSTVMAVCHGVGSGSPLPTAMQRSGGVAFPIAHPAARAVGGTGRGIGLYS
jgi:hypothetical protein